MRRGRVRLLIALMLFAATAITDSTGATSLGEVPGSEGIRAVLEEAE